MQDKEKHISLKEHMQKRPAMYLGAVGSKGIINLVKGLILDSNRELKSEKNFFHFSILAENKFELKIKSNVHVDELLTIPNNDKDYPNKFYFSILNAISERVIINKENDFVICISWELDENIIGNTKVDFYNLSDELLQVAFLNRDSEILITDHTNKFQNQSYFNFPQGVKYVYERCKLEALGKPQFEITFDDAIGENHYQIYIGYRTDWFPNPQIYSFANDVHTVCGGSLVDGIMEGLFLGCETYINRHNFETFNVTKSKFDNGLILVCAVKGKDYEFGGSFKETLIDETVQNQSREIIKKLTIEFIENNKEKADTFLWRFDESQITNSMMETTNKNNK